MHGEQGAISGVIFGWDPLWVSTALFIATYGDDRELLAEVGGEQIEHPLRDGRLVQLLRRDVAGVVVEPEEAEEVVLLDRAGGEEVEAEIIPLRREGGAVLLLADQTAFDQLVGEPVLVQHRRATPSPLMGKGAF